MTLATHILSSSRIDAATPTAVSSEAFSLPKWLGRQVSWAGSHIRALFTSQKDTAPKKNSPESVFREVCTQFNHPEKHLVIQRLIVEYATPQDVGGEVLLLTQYPIARQNFIDNQPLRIFEKGVRELAKNGSTPHREFADCYLNFFSLHTQLFVFKEIDDFMKLDESRESIATTDRLLSELLTTVLHNAGHEVEEILDHLHTRSWLKKANDCIKIVERNIERVIEEDSKAFQEFCKKRKHQFDLPYHSRGIHTALKRTGFAYSPKMVTPDRMICLYCKVHVSGFRAWHDPQSFHRAGVEHPAPELLEARPDVMYTGSDTASEEA